MRSWPCYPTRRFECLAACGSQQTTRFPGEDSFTSALIWALTALGTTRKRFTTLELQKMIMRDAPHFPKGQFVPLLERGEPCDQRLVLAAQFTAPDTNSPASTTSSYIDEPLIRNYMDLRFWFPSRPNEEQVANLAQRLKKLMLDESIGARRIRWQGLKNVDLERRDLDIARTTVNKWKSFLTGSNGTSTALEADLTSSGSRTRPSSLLSLPENLHIASNYHSTSLTKSTKSETYETAAKHDQDTCAYSKLESSSRVGITALFKFFEYVSQYTRRKNKRVYVLAMVGVLSLGLCLSYTLRVRPLALLGFGQCAE